MAAPANGNNASHPITPAEAASLNPVPSGFTVQPDLPLSDYPLKPHAYDLFCHYYRPCIPVESPLDADRLVAVFWRADPLKDKWIRMAAAIDRLGDTINVSLTLFLQACPAIMFFPLAEKYMALMGWTVVQPDNGGPVQARRVQNIASSVLLAQSRNRGATINELILHLIREGMVNTVAGVANPKQSDDEEKTRFASYADVKDQKQSLDVTLLRESIEQRAELRKLKGRGKFVQ